MNVKRDVECKTTIKNKRKNKYFFMQPCEELHIHNEYGNWAAATATGMCRQASWYFGNIFRPVGRWYICMCVVFYSLDALTCLHYFIISY